MKLCNPWPAGRTINPNGKYGMRRHPITGKMAKHRGVDVAGTFPVTAAGPGIVSHIGWNRTGGGHVVIINHGDIHTVYYHGAHKTPLAKGQRVQTGDFIYTSGSTGASTGPHLHFEVRTGRTGQWGTDVDPMPYLQGTGPKPLLPVTGKPSRDTWRELQRALQAGGYDPGRIDGLPGPMTYRALQRWAGAKVDGQFGPETRRKVQQKLGVTPDGFWGPLTWSEIQRRLNTGSL
jgi:murein DD-endopeptidase